MSECLIVGDFFVDILCLPLPSEVGDPAESRAAVSMKLGGFGPNVARWCRSVGVEAALVGAVGRDFDDWFRRDLDGVALMRDVLTVDEPTGLCVSVVAEHGERVLMYERSANDLIRFPMRDSNLWRLPMVVSGYLATVAGFDAWIRSVADHCQSAVHLDLGSASLDFDHDLSRTMLRAASTVKGNREEWRRWGTATDLSTWLVGKHVVVTVGASGVASLSPLGVATWARHVGKATVIDSTGAGDAVTAGVLLGSTPRWSPEQGLALGVALATACVQYVGSFPTDESFDDQVVAECANHVVASEWGVMGFDEFFERAGSL